MNSDLMIYYLPALLLVFTLLFIVLAKVISKMQKSVEAVGKQKCVPPKFFDDLNSAVHFTLGVATSLLSMISIFASSIMFILFMLFEIADFYTSDYDLGDFLEFFAGMLFGFLWVAFIYSRPELYQNLENFIEKLNVI